ncbi:GGDEF domain-containing protein [Rhodoferax saidenbachensis]|uniref:diguanylate cyclase n=1 Tax=Rhodoferax saidenbachensis TaxID=1484693 RepID=A0ABU1ZSC7_9BURK|nr:GGDEF domain-containing protein [Rhodoferax saidenbachensis]MDR7307765.1 diguanylate cyclase (GGDEF)-like protein [Rhodoferax saidenbachensis]
MSAPDLRIFILINGLMALLMALLLFFQARTYPRSIRGLNHWAIGQLLAFFSTLLFGLQGLVQTLVFAGMGNVLLVLSGAYLLVGTCRHMDVALPRYFVPAVAVYAAVAMVWLIAGDAPYLYRLLFICGTMAVLFAAHAAVVGEYGNASLACRVLLTVSVLLTIVMLVRGVTAWVDPPASSIFAASTIQVVYFASFSFGLLLLSIGGVLMATERMRGELEYLVSNDSLTGAYTRRALFALGENEAARCQRLGTEMAALMMDLDHFKNINDKHGHHVGDMVISDFVHRAQTLLRRPAILGRYGGEEFVALLPDTTREEALRVAERIRQSVTTDPALPVCQVSIGVATFNHAAPDTLTALIDRADTGLYRAKQLGRNRVEEALASPSTHANSASTSTSPL